MPNCVDAVNLHTRFERSGTRGTAFESGGQLLRRPLFVHGTAEQSVFPRPDVFEDIRVVIQEDNGEAEQWYRVSPGDMLTASKDLTASSWLILSRVR